MMKKLVSVCLCALMLLSVLPFSAFAAKTVASGVCGEHLSWTLDSDGVLTVSGTGEMDPYVSEEMGDDIAPWYALREQIVKIVIKDGVQSVGDYAFYDCENLRSVSFADSVAEIGAAAFMDCVRLGSVRIPEKVEVLNYNTFTCCYLLSLVEVPDSVRVITGAFYYCRLLEEFHVSEYVEELAADSFDGCSSLTRFTVSEKNPFYAADENGVLFDKTKTTLIKYPSGKKEKTYTVPNGVTALGWDAFGYNIFLREVRLPDSVAAIGSYAFYTCTGLADLVLNRNISSIEEGTYAVCYSLIDVVIPAQIKTLGNYAFEGCSNMESVTLSGPISAIPEYAFYGDLYLDRIYIPKSVKSIGGAAFFGTEPETVYYEGSEAEWNAVQIAADNGPLAEAEVRFGAKPAQLSAARRPYYVAGDVSGNAKVTAEDARLALRAAVGLEAFEPGSRAFLSADASGEGVISAEDARLILRCAVGLETLSGGTAEELAVLIGIYSGLPSDDVLYEKLASEYDLPEDAWFLALIEKGSGLYGTEAQVGDIVVGVNGRPLSEYDQALPDRKDGDPVTFNLVRILPDGSLYRFDAPAALKLMPRRMLSVSRP